MNGNVRLRITGIEAIPISIPSRGFNSSGSRSGTAASGRWRAQVWALRLTMTNSTDTVKVEG